jgi:hypothetical protein
MSNEPLRVMNVGTCQTYNLLLVNFNNHVSNNLKTLGKIHFTPLNYPPICTFSLFKK